MNTRKAVARKKYNFQATFKIVAEGKHFGELIYSRYATREGAEKSLKEANKSFKRWELVSIEKM